MNADRSCKEGGYGQSRGAGNCLFRWYAPVNGITVPETVNGDIMPKQKRARGNKSHITRAQAVLTEVGGGSQPTDSLSVGGRGAANSILAVDIATELNHAIGGCPGRNVGHVESDRPFQPHIFRLAAVPHVEDL